MGLARWFVAVGIGSGCDISEVLRIEWLTGGGALGLISGGKRYSISMDC